MNLLKKRVEEMGIMQSNLADKAGVSKTHISFILNDKREISYNLAKQIYNELGYNSPISLILEFYNFEAKGDDLFNKFKADLPITKTLGKFIISHFKNNELSRNEKARFLGNILGWSSQMVENEEIPDKLHTFKSFFKTESGE